MRIALIKLHYNNIVNFHVNFRPFRRKNLLLGEARTLTQLRNLKPMLSNTLVASHTTGNNWPQVKLADSWYATVHCKLLNIPRIINTSTHLTKFLLKYSLFQSYSFTPYWSSCISSLRLPISVNPTRRIADTPNWNTTTKLTWSVHDIKTFLVVAS